MATIALSRTERKVVFGYVLEATEAIELREGDSPEQLADAIDEIATLKRARGHGQVSAVTARVVANVLDHFIPVDRTFMRADELRALQSASAKFRAAEADTNPGPPPAKPRDARRRPVRPLLPAPGPHIRIRTDIHDSRFELDDPRRLVEFDHVRAVRVDFSRGRFDRFTFRESEFIDCDFSGVRFGAYNSGGDDRKPSRFVGCTFDRAVMPHFGVSTSRFERCTFRGTKITGWRSECAEFVDCLFAARIRDSVFYGRPSRCYEGIDSANESLKKDGIQIWGSRAALAEWQREAPRRRVNEFRGNDFSEADIDYVDLRDGIDVSAQRWPAGDGYYLLDRWPERLRAARAGVDREPPSRRRDDAVALLSILDSTEPEHVLTPTIAKSTLAARGAWDLVRPLLLGEGHVSLPDAD